MKKIGMLAMAALLLLAGCKPSGPVNPQNPSKDPSRDPGSSTDPVAEEVLKVNLTSRNIDVAAVDDYDVSFVNKAITIFLNYADREEAQALDVTFINLPADVEADYKNPYDYSGGKTQEVVFKRKGSTDESKWDKWTLAVEIEAEVPHFTSLTVAGTDITATEQKVHLPSGTDLSKLVVEFTVSPEGSVVRADAQVIASGDEVDFSDRINGVVFTIEGSEESYKVIAETSGISTITRVWGRYVNPKSVDYDNWYEDKLGFSWKQKANWDRNVAIDDNYVYLAATESNDGADGVLAKIWAIDINNADNVKALQIPADIPAQHKTAGLAVVPDGNGTRLLFCTMAMNNAHNFQVYSYTSVDAAPELVLDVPYANLNKRVGDRFTFFGTWQKGEICTVSWSDGTAFIFPVENGKVSATPVTANLRNGGLTNDVAGNAAKLLYVKDNQYVWTGIHLPVAYTRDGNTFVQTQVATTGATGFPKTAHGLVFFEVNGERYGAFTARVNSFQSSALRIFPVGTDASVADILALEDPFAKSWKFGIADPDVEQNEAAGEKDGNGVADTAVRVINGTVYLVSVGCGSGISLFKLQ